ncbi:MAG: HAD family phosphatase [Anaerolineae bacterium]|nr:HAD family phosphatase [Anaerolineae bacterium]MDW8173169.1 HAD family phosphatase [Anaerolineae bacterium]
MSFDAIIFDMDGVLVDSEVYWLKSRQEFAQARGKVWTDADQRQAMGRNTVEWAEVMRERLSLDEAAEAIMSEMIDRVKAHYDERLPLRPGALEAVRVASGRARVALASGSPTAIIQHVMRLTGLDSVFEVMVYGDDYPNGKPAPDVYLGACERLGVDPRRCVGIEDSGNGIRSVVAAGMVCVAAPSPAFPLSEELLALCARKVDTMEALTADFWADLEQTHGQF